MAKTEDGYTAALCSEREYLRKSPDRPAKWRRIAEVTEQIGDEPLPGDVPDYDDGELETAAESAPRQRAVRGKAGA